MTGISARAWWIWLSIRLAAGLLAACAAPPRPDSGASGDFSQDLIYSASRALSPAALDRLAERRVIFMSEIHDRPEHHRDQLRVIRALHEQGVDLALGLESFQRPFQIPLDDYVAGRIGESELLCRTRYRERWGFDVELYREILHYARAQAIPLVALNAPRELVQAVSREGIAALPTESGRSLPASPELAQGAYRRRLIHAFGAHGGPHDSPRLERLERFLEVQMLWDETMARTAAEYLAANPRKTLIILAGATHVGYPDAIPRRLWRRLPIQQAWVFPDKRYFIR